MKTQVLTVTIYRMLPVPALASAYKTYLPNMHTEFSQEPHVLACMFAAGMVRKIAVLTIAGKDDMYHPAWHK